MDSLDIDSMTPLEIQAALNDAKSKLERACRQIAHLDSQISYLRKLFRRAEKKKAYAVRYNLRMQLSIVSGVKVMYHHYAATKEDRINRLRDKVGHYTPIIGRQITLPNPEVVSEQAQS